MKNLKNYDLEKLEHLPSHLCNRFRFDNNLNIYAPDREYARRNRGINVYRMFSIYNNSFIGKPYELYRKKLLKKLKYENFYKNISQYIKETQDWQIDEIHATSGMSLYNITKKQRSWKRKSTYIDLNNIIKQYPTKEIEKPYVFSGGYCTEEVHKITGHKRDNFVSIYEIIEKSKSWKSPSGDIKTSIWKEKGKFLYYQYIKKNTWGGYQAQPSDFHIVVVKGNITYFNSKNDPAYKKYYSKLKKEKKRANKLWKKSQKEKEFCFLSKSELEIKKEKELNTQNILRHGFDPETSFRTNKIYLN